MATQMALDVTIKCTMKIDMSALAVEICFHNLHLLPSANLSTDRVY